MVGVTNCLLLVLSELMNKSEATTKKITISRQAGDWYLSCSFEFQAITTPKKTDVIGVDLGVKTLATLSDGQVFKSVKPLQSMIAKLSRLQYLNRNKRVGSGNWKKAQLKIANLHRRVAFHVAQRNIRKDALNKLTTYVSQEPQPTPIPSWEGS